MSKILRKTALLFGSTAGGSQISQFGSYAAASPAFSTDPAVIQSLSQWLSGWFAAVVGGNSPAIEDWNAFCYVLAYQICYLMQEGVAEYDASTTYYAGSFCSSAGVLYISRTDGNIGHALTDSSNWALQGGDFLTVSASTAMTAAYSFYRSNSTSGNLTQTLPAIASCPLGFRMKIKDVGSGGFNTTVQGYGGTELIDGVNVYGTALNRYDEMEVYNNGAYWDVI